MTENNLQITETDECSGDRTHRDMSSFSIAFSHIGGKVKCDWTDSFQHWRIFCYILPNRLGHFLNRLIGIGKMFFLVKSTHSNFKEAVE